MSAEPHEFFRNNIDYIWQDREIRFDCRPQLLACRRGETLIDSINSVEDTKGNNGERGSLIITNLRIIWVSHANSSINLSIGLSTVISANIKQAKSKLKGVSQALAIISKFNSRYEFVFTSLLSKSPRLFTTIQSILRTYETSKLFRDIKLRGSFIKEKGNLILLPHEEILDRISGVSNLSSEQGNIGNFIFTNVRIVWYANLINNFNLSLPYIQIRSIRVRNSKFGKALVIETFQKAGGYVLGFRIDPIDRIYDVTSQLISLCNIFFHSPIFGVDYVVENINNNENVVNSSLQNVLENNFPAAGAEDVDIIENEEDNYAIASYYIQSHEDNKDELKLEYDPSIGLSIEGLVSGMTLDQLWRIV